MIHGLYVFIDVAAICDYSELFISVLSGYQMVYIGGSNESGTCMCCNDLWEGVIEEEEDNDKE